MARPQPKPELSLYETDFYAWTQEQGARIRARAHNDIDWENVAEEIESVGRSDKYEIEHRLEVLLLHLLKWKYQPEKQKPGWLATIREQRSRLERRIEDSPSLRNFPSLVIHDAYRVARAKAEEETGIAFEVFPESCPFSVTQVMDREFLPDRAED